MRYQSHRRRGRRRVIVFVKRRVLMPVLRWLFEYSRDNFERQRRMNQVLFACVQELAVETARLRQEVRRLSTVKLAFVVQRYGADIAGGSEAHCRELAERLSPRHDITVLTTCARDYVTWENAAARRPRRRSAACACSGSRVDATAAHEGLRGSQRRGVRRPDAPRERQERVVP